METVNNYEARTHLSRLLDEVSGQEIVITKAGKPLARLVPLREHVKQRKLGRLKGKFTVPDDFDTPLPIDVRSEFEGRS